MGIGEGVAGMWSGSERARKDAQRLAAVRAYGIDCLPSDTEDVSPAQSARLAALAIELRRRGVWNKNTPLEQVRSGIRRLVGMARRTEPVGKAG